MQVATRSAATVGPGTTIAEAARIMVERNRKVLCVTDDDGALLGIVDRADLLRAAGAALETLVADEDDDQDA